MTGKNNSWRHAQPNDRPIHPRCALDTCMPRALWVGCTCDELWDYWDGTPDKLDRYIEVAGRMERRNFTAYEPDPDVDLEDNLRGFWKDSEFLDSVKKSRK